MLTGGARGVTEEELIFFLSASFLFFFSPANETGLAEERDEDAGVS